MLRPFCLRSWGIESSFSTKENKVTVFLEVFGSRLVWLLARSLKRRAWAYRLYRGNQLLHESGRSRPSLRQPCQLDRISSLIVMGPAFGRAPMPQVFKSFSLGICNSIVEGHLAIFLLVLKQGQFNNLPGRPQGSNCHSLCKMSRTAARGRTSQLRPEYYARMHSWVRLLPKPLAKLTNRRQRPRFFTTPRPSPKHKDY